jgi:uncharacterized membrane protein
MVISHARLGGMAAILAVGVHATHAQVTLSIIADEAGTRLIYPTGVSADGLVVCGRVSTPQGERAAIWSQATGVESLGTLPGTSRSTAIAVSSDGTYVVGSAGFNPSRPFRWSRASGLQPLPPLTSGGSAHVTSLAADGTAYGGASLSNWWLETAVRWPVAGPPEDLGGIFGATHSAIAAVTPDGRVMVGNSVFSQINVTRPFVIAPWTSNEPSYLGALPGGDHTAATAVSAVGTTIVGTSGPGYYSPTFRWTGFGWPNGMMPFPLPPGHVTGYMTCTSADGAIIAGYASDSPDLPYGNVSAVIWDVQRGVRTLDSYLASLGVNLVGWHLVSVTAMSADGSVIIGWATYQSQTVGYIVRGLRCDCPIPQCVLDYTLDGNADQEDVRFVLDLITGGPSPYNIDLDLNRDGNIDQDDLRFFVNLIAGGECPY